MHHIDYYKILGVRSDAEDAVIRAAHKVLAQKYHPDKFQGDKSFAEDHMKQINEAYRVLSDPELRKEYDHSYANDSSPDSDEHDEEIPENQTGRFRLRCKSCLEDVLISKIACRKCASNLAYIETDTPESDGRAQYVCSSCSNTIKPALLPDRCPSCGELNNEWAHMLGGRWYQPELKPRGNKKSESICITGDFDGEYSGELSNNSGYSLGVGGKSYGIRISGGVLKNVKVVKSPPRSIPKKDPRPIRQQDVDANLHDPGSKKNVPIELHDFRLHNYKHIASETHSDARYIEGRLVGKAYAYIDPKASPSSTETINKSAAAWNNNNQAKSGSSVGTTGGTQANAINSTAAGCLICSKWAPIILSIIIWVICTWKVALLSFLVHRIYCWLDDIFRINNYRIKSKNFRIFWAIILICISLIAIVFLNHYYLVNGCGNTPWWLLVPVLLSLFASLWLIHCFPKTILLLLWYIALSYWCVGKNGNCFFHHLNAPNSLISSSQNTAYQDTQQATSITAPNDQNVRISAQDLVANPSLIKDCRNSIYFPDAVIFELDSDVVLPSAEANLSEVVKVLEKAPDSKFIITGHTDSSGDATNEGYMHNLDLSQRRAESVVSWFQSHGNFSEDQFEARGAGSKFPLTMLTDRLSVNRRVEVRVKCNESK